jgi:hypothetical protein
MRIQFRIVGTVELHDDVWIDLPVVPREGEGVKLPDIPEYDTVVRTVVWYPVVNDEDEQVDPFVYIVLGAARPGLFASR